MSNPKKPCQPARARTWREIDAMSDAELRRETTADGVDPDALVASVRKLGQKARRKFAERIEPSEWFASGVAASFPAYDEAVAAGAPAWLGSAAPPTESLSLVDILGGSSPEHTFWARVSGWSMRDEGIKDGDMILVNAKREAKDGDVVLAHLQSQGNVVKRLRITPTGIVLVSANPDYADILVEDPATLRIQGVVMGRAGTL